jgi:hypothetical protein
MSCHCVGNCLCEPKVAMRPDLLTSDCSEIPDIGTPHKGEHRHPCEHCKKILNLCERCGALFVQHWPYGHPVQFTTCAACRCDEMGQPTDNLDIMRRVLEHEKKSEN